MDPQATDTPVIDAPVDTAPVEQAVETAAPAPVAFDPDKLSAEIKGYVSQREEAISKKYADYEKHQKAAQEWEGVRNDPRFNDWVRTLNAPQAPKAFEITDDQFTAALSDKGQFTKLIQDAARQLLETQVGPQLQQTQQHIEFQQKVTELQQTVSKFPDFRDLDKQGKIEPLIRKYPGLSFEDAYKLAKHETFNEEVDKKARGVVDLKKKATVERPGTPPGARTNRVKAKGRIEAMTMTMEAVRAGRPVPEFESIGDEE